MTSPVSPPPTVIPRKRVSHVLLAQGAGGESSEREGELLKKIGELTVERDFLSNGLGRFR